MYVKQHIALSFSMNKDKILSKMKAGKKQEKNKSYFEDAWYNSLLFFLVRFYSSRVYIPVTSISNIVFGSIKLTKPNGTWIQARAWQAKAVALSQLSLCLLVSQVSYISSVK